MERLALVAAGALACQQPTAAFVLAPHTQQAARVQQLSNSGGTKFVQPDQRYVLFVAAHVWAERLVAVRKCERARTTFDAHLCFLPCEQFHLELCLSALS